MADLLGFERLRKKLNEATASEQVVSVIAEIGKNTLLETRSRQVLLALARDLLTYFKERDASLTAISRNVRNSAELRRVVGLIKQARFLLTISLRQKPS